MLLRSLHWDGFNGKMEGKKKEALGFSFASYVFPALDLVRQLRRLHVHLNCCKMQQRKVKKNCCSCFLCSELFVVSFF